MEVHLVRPEEIHGRTVLLTGAEARHVSKVLRRGPGDVLRLTDGTGRFLDVVIERVGPDGVKATLQGEEADPREEGAPWSTLGLPLLKGDHFELALEKVTELGVHRVVPVIARHSVVKWKEKGGERKLERWRRVAESATKQSGRSWVPEIVSPRELGSLLDEYGDDADVVVADEVESGRRLADLSLGAGRPLLALVGPEGAFSAEEKSLLADRGATAVGLGPYRLRSETAAIALVAALHERKRS